MSKDQTIRFAVGSPEEYHSAVWRFWVHKSEAYMATRAMGKWVKISMHDPDDWRIAFTAESGLKIEGNRIIKRSQRPAPDANGWTQGPSVIVPALPIARRFTHAPDILPAGIKWCGPAAPGNQHQFTVMFAEKTATSASWRRMEAQFNEILGTFKLRNGTPGFVGRREDPVPKAVREEVDNLTTVTITYGDKSLLETLGSSSIEKSVFKSTLDVRGALSITDAALGYDNFR